MTTQPAKGNPPDQMAELFDQFWSTFPIPGEYDAMDDCDKSRWRGVIEAAFMCGAGATACVPAKQEPEILHRLKYLRRPEDRDRPEEFDLYEMNTNFEGCIDVLIVRAMQHCCRRDAA